MSWVIWITGPPGSGKSTLARAAAAQLGADGLPVRRLALDSMRRVVTPVPTYGEAERDLVYRALVWTAAALAEAGVPVIVDATAHRREWRDLARAIIPAFAEVQLGCDLAVCREREATRPPGDAPPGIYARAGMRGARVPGVDVAYEPALSPELTLDTQRVPVAESTARVCDLARGLPAPVPPPPAEGWAVWITGVPGSGKTTIASGVAEALAREGVAVRVLEVAELLEFISAGYASPLAEVIAHRALVYAARVLSEAGLAVVVDATAPVRAWRELARSLIPRFAEIQLLCPSGLCATRERAVRWRLIGCAQALPRLCRRTGPEIALAYEPALRPELTIHTDTQDPWSAVAAALRVVRRLRLTSTDTSWTRTTAG
jgi:adenylylsulfate kinase